MFVSVRRYENVRDIEYLRQKANEGLVPILKANPGFRKYHVIMDDKGNLVSMTIFENKEAALMSNRQAADWVQSLDPGFLPPATDSVTGETQMLIEA